MGFRKMEWVKIRFGKGIHGSVVNLAIQNEAASQHPLMFCSSFLRDANAGQIVRRYD